MTRGIERIGLTLCRDGTAVSTIGFPGLGQDGGDYETCLIGPLSGRRRTYEDVAATRPQPKAFAGHARYVREHGGAAGMIQRLLAD